MFWTSRSPLSSIVAAHGLLRRQPRKIRLGDGREPEFRPRHRSAPSDGGRSCRPAWPRQPRRSPRPRAPWTEAAKPRLAIGHRDGADHAAEHKPIRRFVLRSVRPGELPAADQAVIDGRSASGQEQPMSFDRAAHAPAARRSAPPCRRRRRAARCGAARRAPAPRRTRRDRNGRRNTSAPAPSAAAFACACAKASPTSRKVTRRNAGGRSSAGANGAFRRGSDGMPLRNGTFRFGSL